MLYKPAEVEVETVRRRVAGSKEIYLVDAPWGALSYFRKSGRGSFELLAIRKDSQVVRPIRSAALELADRWIAEVVDDPALGEYVTAASQVGSGRDTPEDDEEAAQDDVVSQLQARILELEAQTTASAERAPLTRGPRSLFDGLAGGSPDLTAQDWKRLQEAAGPQPHRLAQHERQPREAGAQAENDDLAEIELEALAQDDAPADPAQAAMMRFLATQTQVLAQLAAARTPPSDPIAHALQGSGGSGSEGGSSVTGARGVAARDAYLRVLKEFAQAVAARAQTELGLASQTPGMMRQFMERKVPIRELKTLTLMGFFFAHMWEDARSQGDELAEFWAARGLVMVEQWAIDNGRSQMAWLLGGLPDPDTSLLQHRRSDLRPYARLCQSTWIAAQVAYLRDIEFLEGRMKTGTRGGPTHTATGEEAEDPAAASAPARTQSPANLDGHQDVPSHPVALSPAAVAMDRAACVDGPLSPDQLDMQSILSRHVCHFLGAAPLTGELPCHVVPCSNVDLTELVDALAAEFETVAYRKPFPRGDTAELLAVDDHVVAQKLTRNEFRAGTRARDTEIFEQAEKAYRDVQLVQHEKKRKRNLLQGVFLGAEVDGEVGLVGAPRHRTGVLMYLTCQLVFRGTATSALLASIIGLWIHVLMFRRPALCILSAAFVDAGHLPRDAVFPLSRQTLNELAALVVLGPVLQADLRVEYTPFLYAMDASPSGAGICRAPVPQHVIAELWRHTEQKGYYSKLESPAAALLREQGLEPTAPSEMPKLGFCAETLFPRPLQEGILFDVLEVFSGSKVWTRAHVQLGMSAHPGIDIAEPPPFSSDLGDKTVFQEVLALVLRRVVGEFHFGPPCRTFGTLRRPRLRSKTRLARRTAFLCSLILRMGGSYFGRSRSDALLQLLFWFALHETYAVVTQQALMAAGSLQAKRGALEIIPLSIKCACLEEFGWIVPSHNGESDESLAVGPTSRAFFDDPEWVGELADSLPFEEIVRYRFIRQGHINIQEARARKTWLKHLCRFFRRSRTVGLIDSRVLLGASAKGRSSSAALSHVQRTELPFVLGGGLYTGGLHIYSSKNRADGPSRDRPPEAPTKALPVWYEALCRRDYSLFDVYLASQGVPKLASRWLRLLLLLGGDIERNPGPATGVFGATGRRSARLPRQPQPQVSVQSARAAALSGSASSTSSATQAPAAAARGASLPPGRHACAPARPARGPLDLQSGFAASTRQKMTKSLEAFRCWLLDEFGLSLQQVLSSQRSAALALRAYGLALFEGGFPRYLLVYAITAVQDLCPEFRSHLTPAWQIDKKWQLAEPGSCRPVISRPVLLAALSLALLWGWADWAAVTLLGFLCMLHPNEFIVLSRGDLVLPVDALSAD
ncbi:unnamed protein product, partial [Symbiodinium necroappetens]